MVGVDADERATYVCSLDGGGYAPCSATTSYSGLHPGWHTFAVRATDESGNTDPTPAVLRVRLKGRGNGGD